MEKLGKRFIIIVHIYLLIICYGGENMPGILIDYWTANHNHNFLRHEQKQLAKDITQFFANNTHAAGSLPRLESAMTRFPQSEHAYIIAGSVATELMTGKPFNHTDIDLLLTKDMIYLDDATISAEYCNGLIPYPKGYFENYMHHAILNGRPVKTLDAVTQIAHKVIGELTTPFTLNANSQLDAIAEYIKTNNTLAVKPYTQLESLYRALLPASAPIEDIIQLTAKGIDAMHRGRTHEWKESLNTAHMLTQEAYQRAFEEYGLQTNTKNIIPIEIGKKYELSPAVGFG